MTWNKAVTALCPALSCVKWDNHCSCPVAAGRTQRTTAQVPRGAVRTREALSNQAEDKERTAKAAIWVRGDVARRRRLVPAGTRLLENPAPEKTPMRFSTRYHVYVDYKPQSNR